MWSSSFTLQIPMDQSPAKMLERKAQPDTQLHQVKYSFDRNLSNTL